MKIALLLTITLLATEPSFAQEKNAPVQDSITTPETRPDPAVPQGTNLQKPLGWIVRLDRPDPSITIGANSDDDDIYFVNMTPGWRITTHNSGIYYHPANLADGSFTAKTSISLFDPGSRDREGFGLFVGGKNLDQDDQEYVYFLLRNTGDFLIKRRTGTSTSLLKGWTHTDAMKVHPHDGTESVENTLEVRANDQDVVFLVNGTEVAKLPRKGTPVDGVVGLRVNHGLSLHVTDLSAGM